MIEHGSMFGKPHTVGNLQPLQQASGRQIFGKKPKGTIAVIFGLGACQHTTYRVTDGIVEALSCLHWDFPQQAAVGWGATVGQGENALLSKQNQIPGGIKKERAQLPIGLQQQLYFPAGGSGKQAAFCDVGKYKFLRFLVPKRTFTQIARWQR